MDEAPILHNVYETPIKLMPDGSHEPLLATEWAVSADGRDYTLRLRDNVRFHNGKNMTAEDVAFSLNGAAKTVGGRTLLINYDTAEVIDEKTVVVHLTSPYAAFLNSLSSRFALVVDKDYFDQVGIPGYHAAPVGTGPYRFVERVSGNHISLKANEDYWGGVPPIKNITYRVMTDANTQMLALENGEVDVLLNGNISQLVRLPENSPVKWASTEAAQIQSVNINCAKGPGVNKDFRKALQYGINKKDIIAGVMEGKADPTDIYMAKSFSGRPDDGTFRTVSYDPEKAKEYLKSSGYKGEVFLLATPSGGKDEQVAQIIQGQLIELGINCALNALDAVSFMNFTTYGTGDYGASIRAGGVSILDADGLWTLFNGSMKLIGTFDTGWILASPKMAELTEAGRSENDPEKRKMIYAEVCDINTEEVYIIPIYCGLSIVAYNQGIQGVVPRALTGLYYFNDWHY
jgi:peptide/nickel transport system substrate-binding protein